jgi:hypothetical protein
VAAGKDVAVRITPSPVPAPLLREIVVRTVGHHTYHGVTDIRLSHPQYVTFTEPGGEHAVKLADIEGITVELVQ